MSFDRSQPANSSEPSRTQFDRASRAMSQTRGIDPSRENPFLTIWIRPRSTIRGIIDVNPNHWVIPLASAGGILQTLQTESSLHLGSRLSLPAILMISVVVGPLIGLLGLYVGAWFVAVTCRPFGGWADPKEVRTALAWSSVPLLATAPFWAIRIALLGTEMFALPKPSLVSNPAMIALLIVSIILEIVLSVWWLVVTLIALGEVQHISTWKTLGVFVLILIERGHSWNGRLGRIRLREPQIETGIYCP